MKSLTNTYHKEWVDALISRLTQRMEQAAAGHFMAGLELAARGNMEIADWRKKIDELDEQIVALLCERAAAAVEIGKLKQQAAAPIYEPQREKAVYDHVRTQVGKSGPESLTAAQIQDIYERIMDVMRSLQRPASGTEHKA